MKYFIAFTLFIFTIGTSFTQNVFVEYNCYRNFFTTENRAQIAALQPEFLKRFDNEYDRFELTANAVQSRYELVRLMFKDTLMPKLKSTRTNAIIYLNFAQQYIYHTYHAMPEKVGRDTLLTLQDWRIVDGEKEIAGYICKKAIRKDAKGNEVVAWFTLEIPIRQGPNGIYGLPGFILGVEDKHFNILAHKILMLPAVEIKMPVANSYLTLKEIDELNKLPEPTVQKKIRFTPND